MSNANENAQAFAVPILKALGIDPSLAISLTIQCEGGALPMVTVVKLVPQGLGEAAATLVQRFRLELIDDATPGPSLDESVSLGTLVRTTHRLADSPGCDRS